MNERLGTIDTDGDRWRLRFERTLPHAVARVWPMISTGEGLSRWFPARVELDALVVGAPMRFVFTEADIERARQAGVADFPLHSDGHVLEIDPPHRFVFDWVGEVVRVELHPDPAGCRLVFMHTFDPDRAQAPKNGAGWHVCLDVLAAALAGGDARVEGPDDALMARYARELSLP